MRSPVSILLGRIEALADLPVRELDCIAAAASRRSARPNETILEKEDPPERAYLVVDGLCKVVAPGPQGKDTTLDLFGPGEFLGELSILDGGGRSARVVAVSNTQLLAIERAAFLELLETCPALCRQLLVVMARRMRRLTGTLENVTGLGVRPRLARKLLDLAERQGVRTGGGTKINLKIPQDELGRMIGAVRESVNKYVGEFKDAGYIRMDGMYVVVVNREALLDLSCA